MHFFDISTSKSGPSTRCFVHFDLQVCLAPQAACNFSSLIWPAGSAPAALASLLFDPPPQIIGKTQCFATFLPFHASASSFFLLFFLLIFLFSLPLPCSAFHPSSSATCSTACDTSSPTCTSSSASNSFSLQTSLRCRIPTPDAEIANFYSQKTYYIIVPATATSVLWFRQLLKSCVEGDLQFGLEKCRPQSTMVQAFLPSASLLWDAHAYFPNVTQEL